MSRRPDAGERAKRSPPTSVGPSGPTPPTPACEGPSLGPGEASEPLAEAPGAGLGLGFGAGFGAGFGVGFEVGLGVGLGVGRGVGVGLGGRLTTTEAGLTLVNVHTVPFGRRALNE